MTDQQGEHSGQSTDSSQASMAQNDTNNLSSDVNDSQNIPNSPPIVGAKFKKYEPLEMPTPETIAQQDIIDSCITRSIFAGLAGGVMGAAMGLIFAPMDTAELPQGLAFRQKMYHVMVQTRQKCWSYSRGFAVFGVVYSGSECVIESYRAQHDMYNSIGAGCFTGAAISYQGGVQAMCIGCVAIATFSAIIDRFMDVH